VLRFKDDVNVLVLVVVATAVSAVAVPNPVPQANGELPLNVSILVQEELSYGANICFR
jgi:hypothetical protein